MIEQKQMKDVVSEPIQETEEEETNTEESEFQAERYQIARGIESQQLENAQELRDLRVKNENDLQKKRLEILETKRQLLAKINATAQQEEDDQKVFAEKLNKALIALINSCGEVGNKFKQAYAEALEILYDGTRANHVIFDFHLVEDEETHVEKVAFSVSFANSRSLAKLIDEKMVKGAKDGN